MDAKQTARLILARDFLKGYDKLETKETDRAGWLQLKFSCSRGEAEKLLLEAEKN